MTPRLTLKPRPKGFRSMFTPKPKFCWRLEHEDGSGWLPDCEASILICVIMNKNVATTEQFMEAVWPDPDTMPDYWDDALKVHRSKLNKRLRKMGWEVRNIRDHMFSLFPYSPKPVQFEDERPFEWLI